MTPFVVDASVAVKWYVPEIQASEALRLLQDARNGDAELHAPDALYLEAASVFWKKYRRHELQRSEARDALASIVSSGIAMHGTEALLPSAFTIAMDAGTSIYDSLYLALAAALDCLFVTADRKLLVRVSGTNWSALVRWVGEV